MMKMKGVDNFERSLKESLEAYEVPYNSADWSQLEQQLDTGKTTTWQASAALYALFLGGAIAVMTTVYVMLNTDPGGNGQQAMHLLIDENDSAGETGNEELASLENKEVVTDEEPADEVAETLPMTESAAASPETLPIAVAKNTDRNVPAKADRSPVAAEMATVNSKADAATPTNTGLTIRATISEGCPGTTVEFAADNMPEGGMHLWNFGDGSFSNKAAPAHTFSKSGTFEVMLSSHGGGNMMNKPAADRIVIHEAPEAAFNYLKQEYENTVPSVHFENRSIGGSTYLWEFGDGTSSAVAHPNHVFKKKGTYQVMLTTTNGKGCVDRTERTIVIDKDYDLLAPKTFSPDGNGVEDTFIPDALKTLGAKFHMSIFNSNTGEPIYETSDPQRPWNGRIGNKGDLCGPGDYVWLVEMKAGDKLGGTYTGNITLLR